MKKLWPQIVRKLMQLSALTILVYAAVNTVWRNFKLAHNNRRLVELMHGETMSKLYGLNNDFLELLGDPYEVSFGTVGIPWSARVFGIETADPVLLMSHILDVGVPSSQILLAALVPVVVAIILGKVFCSHLCPMRLLFDLVQSVRRGLLRLGVPLPEVRSTTRLSGWVLLGGLLASSLSSIGVWFFILPYLSVTVGVVLLINTGAASFLFGIAGAWLIIDLFFAPGLFCFNVCPTGFVLEKLGTLSPFQLRKVDATACPSSCTVCIDVCPYRLSPKTQTHRSGCDNCGVCASSCPQSKLARTFEAPSPKSRALPVLGSFGAALFLVFSSTASAHHNKGLPHYGYYENYPQVPTEEYLLLDGDWEIGATVFNFQGLERVNAESPNDVKIYLYLYNLKEKYSYRGATDFEIRLDDRVVSSFTRAEVDEEAIYSTRETLPESGDYVLVARPHSFKGLVLTLPFSVDLATDAINWWLILALLLPAVVIFGLAIVGRSRRRKVRRKPVSKKPAVAALILPLLLTTAANAEEASSDPHAHHKGMDHSDHAKHKNHEKSDKPTMSKTEDPHAHHKGMNHSDHAKHKNHEKSDKPTMSKTEDPHAHHKGMNHSDHAKHKNHEKSDKPTTSKAEDPHAHHKGMNHSDHAKHKNHEKSDRATTSKTENPHARHKGMDHSARAKHKSHAKTQEATTTTAEDSHAGHGGMDHSAHSGHAAANASSTTKNAHAGHAGMDHGAHANGDMHANMDHANMGHADMGHADMDHAAMGHQGHTMEHFETEDGGQIMVMGGIPTWLFLFGIASLIIFTFIGVERFGSGSRRGFRFNLVKNKKAYALVKSRWFQAIPQLAMVLVLVYLTYAGLFGSRVRNITPVAVWTIWWAGLIFAIVLAGPIFCFACPWDGLANLFSRLRVKARVTPLSINLPYPRWLATLYPAIWLFVVLTWLELGFGVTTNPRTTAYMGLAMGGMAVAFALLFDGKRFCHHFCPVGRISGIYSNFSPVEIRAKKPAACKTCRTEDCLNGNENGYPCPTGISLKIVQDATYCTMCTECVKSCNRNNVAINLRPFGTDLDKPRPGRMDEAWLSLSLLSLTLFHGFSMTPAWENFRPGGDSMLKWMSTTFGTPHAVNFTIGMLALMAVPVFLYWLSCEVGALWTKYMVPTRTLFVQYSYSILPVALFYHLAHNAMHLFMEGGEILPLLSDPLGRGTDYFGTRDGHYGALLGETTTWYIQVALILIGHVFGILVAHRISRRLYDDKASATRSLVPMLVMMVVLSVCGLGLMHLDMNMRVGRM